MINIIKSGVGYIGSIIRIIEDLDYDYKVVSKPLDLDKNFKIILPGVGSFDSFVQSLIDQKIFSLLKDLVVINNIPILGICVGMQALFTKSQEGVLNGLNLLDGECFKFDHKTKKVPHIGWNSINIKKNVPLTNSISKNIFYFAHSYFVNCKNQDIIIGTTDYIHNFTSIINKQNIYGVQFHPEKSYDQGKAIIKNFIELC